MEPLGMYSRKMRRAGSSCTFKDPTQPKEHGSGTCPRSAVECSPDIALSWPEVVWLRFPTRSTASITELSRTDMACKAVCCREVQNKSAFCTYEKQCIRVLGCFRRFRVLISCSSTLASCAHWVYCFKQFKTAKSDMGVPRLNPWVTLLMEQWGP